MAEGEGGGREGGREGEEKGRGENIEGGRTDKRRKERA